MSLKALSMKHLHGNQQGNQKETLSFQQGLCKETTATVKLSRPFSEDEALECIRRADEELNKAGTWPENFMAWLQVDHKNKDGEIKAATDAVDHACLNQDAEAFEKALAGYRRACLEGLTLWRNREQQ